MSFPSLNFWTNLTFGGLWKLFWISYHCLFSIVFDLKELGGNTYAIHLNQGCLMKLILPQKGSAAYACVIYTFLLRAVHVPPINIAVFVMQSSYVLVLPGRTKFSSFDIKVPSWTPLLKHLKEIWEKPVSGWRRRFDQFQIYVLWKILYINQIQVGFLPQQHPCLHVLFPVGKTLCDIQIQIQPYNPAVEKVW